MFAKERQLLDRIYPEFPADEYKARNDKVRRAMADNGLDAILVSELKNVEYFTGCMTTIGPRVGVIPVDGDPLLLVPAYLSGTAERTSWVRNITRYAEAHLKKESMGFAGLIVALLRQAGLDKGTIGLEYPEDMQFSESGLHFTEYDHIRESIPTARFVSGSKAIWKCRTVKSPLEIEKLETAARIMMQGYHAAREKVREGVTEIEIARLFRSTFVEEQAKCKHNTSELGYMNIRAGPERYAMADTFNQDRRIKKGEVLIMNCGAWYRRYYANFSRYAFVGKPTDKHMKAHRAVEESVQAFQDHLASGIPAGDVHKHAIAPLQSCKCGETFDHTGIGVGLYAHEPPYIAPDRTELLEPGNVFSFQAWIYDVKPGGMGVLGYEHEFAVTQKGCRPIVPREDELLWVV